MTFKAHLIQTKRGIEPEYFTSSDEKIRYSIEDVLTTRATSLKAEELHIVVGFGYCKVQFIEWLFNSEKWHYSENDKDKSMSFVVRTDYIVLHYHPGNTLTVTAFEVKYKQDFEDWQQASDLEAADRWKRATCSLDAKAQWWETFNSNAAHGRNITRINFPEATLKELRLLNAAKMTTKQYMYFAPGEYKNIWSYDIKQSYPARLYRKYCPVGHGIYFTCAEQIPDRYWYVARIYISALEARSRFDFLNLMDKKPPFYTVLTEQSITILNTFYAGKWRMIDGYAYKLRRGQFDKMFEENFNDPGNSKPHIRRYNKFRNNLLLGTFGATDNPTIIYKMQKGKIITKVKSESDKTTYKYLPVYLYVVGAARLALARIIYENRDAIIYANTDGVFATCELFLIQPAPPGQPGSIELRAMYTRLAIKEMSDYCGEYVDEDGVVRITEKLSGRRLISEASYAEYVNGTLKTEKSVADTSGLILANAPYPEIPLNAITSPTTHETADMIKH